MTSRWNCSIIFINFIQRFTDTPLVLFTNGEQYKMICKIGSCFICFMVQIRRVFYKYLRLLIWDYFFQIYPAPNNGSLSNIDHILNHTENQRAWLFFCKYWFLMFVHFYENCYYCNKLYWLWNILFYLNEKQALLKGCERSEWRKQNSITDIINCMFLQADTSSARSQYFQC